jgi:type II secretory pathway component GspD/PulD (secretin)
MISDASGMKLITSAEIARKSVSVYLPGVTAKEALQAVCAAHDLYCEEDKDTGVIVVKEVGLAFFPLEHVDAKQVQLLVPGLMGPKGKVAFDDKNQFITVQGTHSEIEMVRALVQRIDETPRQVLIEATLAELDETAEAELGIRWDVNMTKLPFGTHWVTLDEDAKAWVYGFVSAQDFFVQLQLMETDGKANILANPRICAVDRKEASIQVVAHTVVATKLTRQTGTLDLVTEEPVYADVGVTLKMTPRIHPDGKVTLVVEPSVSTATRSRFFAQGVDTNIRNASTTILAGDGETFAIGGLLRNDVTETKRKFPFLGDVPVLGYLFSHKATTTRKTDLVVFLTPHLLTSEKIKADYEKRKDVLGGEGK